MSDDQNNNSPAFATVPIQSIVIDRSQRQRTKIDTSALQESIQQHGLLQPIVVQAQLDGSFRLIAGERRLTSCINLGYTTVPVRLFGTLTEIEQKTLEYEENSKRSDLHWRDHVQAIAKLHELNKAQDANWSISQTGQLIGMNYDWVRKILRIWEDFDSPKIQLSGNLSEAYNVLFKLDQRRTDQALGDILAGGGAAIGGAVGGAVDGDIDTTAATFAPHGPMGDGAAPIPGGPSTAPQANPAAALPRGPKPAADSILSENFLEWAPAYSGAKFNFIHCDFPYGTNLFDGAVGADGSVKMSGRVNKADLVAAGILPYNDDPQVYWDLCKCLCESLDRVMAHAGHLMFWFTMKHYTETIEFFRQNAPELDFQPYPLIWHKTDNAGLIRDTRRTPRLVYETALVASRGDRFMVRPLASAYGAPTDRRYHPSTKPEPMLRHFFGMFVDETTSMLDPTCGSGAALRAAESLGAAHVLGLEINPEYVDSSREALHKFRLLNSL